MQTAVRGNEIKSILLVIEPDAETRSGMKRLLEMSGFIVTAVANEGEAGNLAKLSAYDLILFDSDLPPPASFAAAYRLNQRAQLHDLPVLVISVHDKPDRITGGSDSDKFSVAYLAEVSRFDELGKLIDCLVRHKN